MWLSLHISLAITSCGYVLHSGIVIWTRVCVVAPPHESGFDVLWICFTLWYGNMDQGLGGCPST